MSTQPRTDASTPDLLPPDMLAGVRVAVSASPSPDHRRLGLRDEHFRLALGEIARAVVVLGGGLLYGGHLEPDGLTVFLVGEVKRYGRQREPLQVVLPWPVHRRLPLAVLRTTDDDLGLAGTLTCLGVGGEPVDCAAGRGEEPADVPMAEVAPSLTAMRRTTTGQSHARVLIGGRRNGYQGVMPGVLEEALVTLAAARPLYLAGGFGGMTLDVVRVVDPPAAAWLPAPPTEEPTDAGYHEAQAALARAVGGRGWDALGNGLDPAENARLAATYRPSEIATLVSLGLGRLTRDGRFGG